MRSHLALCALLWAACLGSQDNPTTVHDLRVLGLRFDPPEMFITGCTPALFGALLAPDAGVGTLSDQVLLTLAAGASQPITFTSLIADPHGQGRELQYELRVCANTGDRTCSNADDFLVLASGTTTAPEETRGPWALGAMLLPDTSPLLLKVIQQDTYKGLGGIRIPAVLHLTAADTHEEIYAQKLMVYQCPFFPSMKQNVQPVLPGMLLEGQEWAADEVRPLSGAGPFKLEPMPFDELEEPYVVPSLSFQPVDLVERWKVSRYSTLGTISPSETGGTDLSGQDERHLAQWTPGKNATEQDVTFWFVVRDGRGGQTWLTRHAHWAP